MAAPPPKGSFTNETIQLNIPIWSDRFFAWMIDFLISYKPRFHFGWIFILIEYFELWKRYLILYGSWYFFCLLDLFESTRGHYLGKVILHLKTVSISGGPVKISDAAIVSFGRSFLQHFDLILGWIFNHTKRQRIFNMASNTIVVMSFC
jgi:uncharacterized RDD family membrane protein YckC